MAKITGPYTIPDDHISLVGRIAGNWAHLEFEIDFGIWHLANTHQQLAACITSQLMSIHPRLKAFIALVEVRAGSAASVKALKSFQGSIADLVELRNRTVHDPRFKQKDTNEIHRLEITAKPRVQFGFLPEPKKELEQTLERIRAKVIEFKELRDRAIAEIDALPEASRPTLLQIVPGP